MGMSIFPSKEPKTYLASGISLLQVKNFQAKTFLGANP